MSRRPGVTGKPRDYVLANGTYPTGPFRKDTPSTVLNAAAVAVALQRAITESGASMTATAGGIGVARSTLYDILGGQTIVDVYVLTLLEEYFDRTFWPTRGS